MKTIYCRADGKRKSVRRKKWGEEEKPPTLSKPLKKQSDPVQKERSCETEDEDEA